MPSGIRCGRGRCRAPGRTGSWRRRRRSRSAARTGLGRAGVLVADDRARRPGRRSTTGRDRLGARPERRARPSPPARRPSRRARGAAPRSRSGGKSGCSGQASSSVMPCAIERSPSKRWNSASAVGEAHVVELADRRGVRPSPQVFSRGKRFFSTTSDPMAARREPVRGRRARRSRADDEHVDTGVAVVRTSRAHEHMITCSRAVRSRSVAPTWRTMCRGPI